MCGVAGEIRFDGGGPDMAADVEHASGAVALARRLTRDLSEARSGPDADELLAGYGWYPPLAAGPGADAARWVVPDDVTDRPEGYFPVPAIQHLGRPVLDRVRDALPDPIANARGLVRRDRLDTVLVDPNSTQTNLGSNALWHATLPEMWLQERGL